VTITIGGTDITKYIKYQGITFSRNDVEAPDAGRDLSGLMHRGRVAIKERMDIQTVQLTKAQAKILHDLLLPESFSVTVNPYPNTNASKTMTMYSNDVKTTYVIHRANGEDLQEMSFPLVEM
jgi:7-cyano-7-deazaguanine synthase in queuosine biosynthesis